MLTDSLSNPCWSSGDDPLAQEPLLAAESSIEESLADRSLPLKIGLNLWLTDEPEWRDSGT